MGRPAQGGWQESGCANILKHQPSTQAGSSCVHSCAAARCRTGHPWTRQAAALTVDDSVDYVTDKGAECWNILHAGGIKNVVLLGVHTNMCVVGRPFGLRQLVRGGRHNVVLMRDMTDTMYNPARLAVGEAVILLTLSLHRY